MQTLPVLESQEKSPFLECQLITEQELNVSCIDKIKILDKFWVSCQEAFFLSGCDVTVFSNIRKVFIQLNIFIEPDYGIFKNIKKRCD